MRDHSDTDDVPVLDAAYLDDMRGWVGDEVLAELLEAAPMSLDDMIGGVRGAWENGDLAAVHEAGHRLKGGAASIACRRLAELAHRIQTITGLEDSAALTRISREAEAAKDAIAGYRAGLTAS